MDVCYVSIAGYCVAVGTKMDCLVAGDIATASRFATHDGLATSIFRFIRSGKTHEFATQDI